MTAASSPTPYRVSTITAVGGVGSSVDIQAVFDVADVGGKASAAADGESRRFVFASLGGETRGVDPGRLKRKRRGGAARKPKLFGNQVTTVIEEVSGIHGGAFVNAKVFQNGRVQMTGVKDVDQGRRVLDWIVAELARMGVVECRDRLAAVGYRVCLINTDFDLSLRVKRDLLLRCLRRHHPSVQTSFEPCIYPGLKIKYMWREGTDAAMAGCCTCAETCCGRGVGAADKSGQCRKVSVAVFQSGKVIVTGAHTMKQIDDTYAFLLGLVAEHGDAFRMPDAPPPAADMVGCMMKRLCLGI